MIGVGHFGSRHAEKMARLKDGQLVAVADIDAARANEIAAKYGLRAATDHRDLLDSVDAVSIAVPTVSHYEVAKDFLARGIHVLVEKPIARDVASGAELVALAEQSGAILHVGHLARFHGVTDALRRHLTRPLFIDCVRIAPFQPRGTDVNVVLDLMIHDIDLVLSLVEGPLDIVDAAGAPVFTAEEDIATVRLKFANGCIANITASRIGFKTERKMRVFQPNSFLTVDFGAQRVLAFSKRGETVFPQMPDVAMAEERYEEVDALQREIETFAAAVAGKPLPAAPITGRDALRALETAQEVTARLRAHARLIAGAPRAEGDAPERSEAAPALTGTGRER